MKDLQTVLDALNLAVETSYSESTNSKFFKAIAIVKQMMQAEPVAWRVWSPDGTNVYQYTEDGDGEPLFTAPKGAV